MFKKKKKQRIAKQTEKPEYNELTQRHLDYYNEDIKQLEETPATPDDVKDVFESSKSKKKAKKARVFRKKS